jgi:hypothetical protein
MAFIKEPYLMKFKDPICLQEALVRIYSTKKPKNEAAYKTELLKLTSYTTYAMHGSSFLRFATCLPPKPKKE